MESWHQLKTKTKCIINFVHKAKDQTRKQNLHEKFKTFRNSLANLIREGNKNYYEKHFDEDKTNVIKVWKGIKEVILINKSNKTQPTCLKTGDKQAHI